ncbi:MAG: type II/IV secretion system protein [Patescibacteria group bacterium]|nr:type II/IV secretion system protein [Patescibacteria group bacterium]
MANHFLASTPAELQSSLDDLNRRMEEEETKAKAGALGLPYIDLHNFPMDLQVLGLFTEAEAKEMGAVPFYKDLSDLRVGTTNPEHPLLLSKLDEFQKQGSKVSLYYISRRSLLQALRFYSKVMRPKAQREETVRVEKQQDFGAALKGLQNETAQKQLSASQLVELLFGAGMFYQSSDIHIEPEEHFVKLRLRVDGVLQDVLHLTKDLQRALVMRIKILAKLKLNVENAPQDGRITFYYLGQPIDVRVSVLPSAYGEEIVMRLLGTGAVNLRLQDLGFRPQQQELIHQLLARPNGCVITTGPTGSGKTTSLYAFLNELNEPGVKIITLEDPVEYKLEGIVQTPIDHTADFDFAKGLRAILRQDPDVVMVGEIRDQETAEVALQAALTGHMVLSTLHTNDAAGAIPRLINMGVKPFILAPALSAVLAQRLVRRICQHCKVKTKMAAATLKRVEYALGQIPSAAGLKPPKDLTFYHSPGCEQCRHLGYQGRVGIYEVLQVTDAVQQLIMKQASMVEFRQAAAAQGMLTMLQDGLLKALDGLTDVEEVFRVAGEG